MAGTELWVHCGPLPSIHKQSTLQCIYNCYLYVSDLRQPTQDAPEEVRARDFRRELEERERVAAREKTRERGPRGRLVCVDVLTLLLYICSDYVCLNIVPTQASD